MAKKKKMTIPVALLAPPAMLAAGPLSRMARGEIKNGAYDLGYSFTGIAVNDAGAMAFDPSQAIKAAVAIGVGYGIHKYLGPVINRGLSNAGVPILRL